MAPRDEATPQPAQSQQAVPSVPGGATGLSPDGLEQIRQLARLLNDQGALTDEEFAHEKAKFLGGKRVSASDPHAAHSAGPKHRERRS